MFKDKIKTLRIEKGLTQKQLADIIYVSRSAVCKWEMGNGYPSDVNLESLCLYFNVTEDYLMERNDYKESKKNLERKIIKTICIISIIIPTFIYIKTFIPYRLIHDMFAAYHEFTSDVMIHKWWIIIPHLIILSPVFMAISYMIFKKNFERKYSRIICVTLILFTCLAIITDVVLSAI